MRFCVIADDITGAMDTGVGLAKAGLAAAITFSGSMNPGSDSVVATTDSRAESPSEAYRRVKAVGELFHDYYIYKKIDSTLRGNIAAEKGGDIAAADFFPTGKGDVGGLESRIAGFQQGAQPFGFDHANGFL